MVKTPLDSTLYELLRGWHGLYPYASFLNYSITHSHPYLPGADGLPHHEHSTVAFNTIEELTELCMELIPYLPLVMAWALLMVVLVFLKKEVVLRLVRRSESRAPPSFGIVI